MWSASRVLMERTMESLSMTSAVLGMCSLICMSPLVLIGLNWPPVEVPGLRSQMSIVEGPPLIHSMMAALCRFFRSAALARRVLVRDMAGAARAAGPAMWLMKWRRLMPVGVVNMVLILRLVAVLCELVKFI